MFSRRAWHARCFRPRVSLSGLCKRACSEYVCDLPQVIVSTRMNTCESDHIVRRGRCRSGECFRTYNRTRRQLESCEKQSSQKILRTKRKKEIHTSCPPSGSPLAELRISLLALILRFPHSCLLLSPPHHHSGVWPCCRIPITTQKPRCVTPYARHTSAWATSLHSASFSPVLTPHRVSLIPPHPVPLLSSQPRIRSARRA